eukprot:TRINITY_DN18099_c0_g1_i3.p1 TRINITY_DN18099_c0_g1~~TRINITY_DN18099_c0_g1_i3.p1  ORF type:complete len:204 (-),score=14.55 TRINITY_DN18099_c0_g1_i3:152-679(-)
MSAGCYALIGMHLGDLFLNWHQTRYRKPKLVILVLLIAFDLLNVYLSTTAGETSTSHSAHLGGYSIGLILGILLGRNLVVKWWERCLQAFLVGLACGLFAFCVAWNATWPPRTMWDMTPWCWARQVYNQSVFGDVAYHCVRCQDQSCIDEFSGMRYVEKVSFRMCDSTYGWKYSQ